MSYRRNSCFKLLFCYFVYHYRIIVISFKYIRFQLSLFFIRLFNSRFIIVVIISLFHYSLSSLSRYRLSLLFISYVSLVVCIFNIVRCSISFMVSSEGRNPCRIFGFWYCFYVAKFFPKMRTPHLSFAFVSYRIVSVVFNIINSNSNFNIVSIVIIVIYRVNGISIVDIRLILK